MGQSSSHPERAEDGGRSRRSILRHAFGRSTPDGTQPALGTGEDRTPRRTTGINSGRRPDGNRLSQMLQPLPFPFANLPGASERAERGDLLHRTRSTLRDILHREQPSTHNDSHSLEPQHAHSNEPRLRSHQPDQHRPSTNRAPRDYFAPRLPSLDITSTFDNTGFTESDDPESMPSSSNSNRRPNLAFNPLRPDRPFRQLASSLRRRRSPQRSSSIRRAGSSEDQATTLSRLLSVAAAATAATLMGDDPQALSEARSLTGNTGAGQTNAAGEDGSFDGFLRALQNGELASALRNGSEGGDFLRDGQLNLFRMFRFGSSGGNNDPATANSGTGDSSEASEASEARMVPIIIVGIRSIPPNSGSGSSSPTEELPPFMDALRNLPTAMPTNVLGDHGSDSIDSILRPPQNGTSFRHRRRASMGGLGMGRSRITDRLDDQRDHRSPDRRRERPWSVASSSSAQEPRPPPATPASPSPELSRISSRASTPAHSRPASFIANSLRDFQSDLSRRNSILRAPATGGTLGPHAEETISMHSEQSSDNLAALNSESNNSRIRSHRRSETAPSVHYPRFASGHPRRNGVVEPDNLPSLSRRRSSNATESSNGNTNSEIQGDNRSWIIYVLGGSYPENHPILTTPSLFTENPTYEDMMLLSALLGPAKPPVATDEDVQSAGGVYKIEQVDTIEQSTDSAKTAHLVAIATESQERIEIETDQRCLVCLCDFSAEEVCRKLVKCNHLFHKECIDQWLTQGRNSCPLCRSQGVDEKATSSETSTPTEEPPELEQPAPTIEVGNGEVH